MGEIDVVIEASLNRRTCRELGIRPDARDRTKARSRERSRRSPPRGSRNGDHGEARSRNDDHAERERRGPGPGGTSLLFRNIGERNTVDDLRDEALWLMQRGMYEGVCMRRLIERDTYV